jgi:hypothetical protein
MVRVAYELSEVKNGQLAEQVKAAVEAYAAVK